MDTPHLYNTPTAFNPHWRMQLFSADAVKRKGVVRRKKGAVHREIGLDLLKAEVRARGFQLYDVGTDYMIVCHAQPIYRIG
jgi:methanogenic corrinoid protein MtbC1